MPKRILILILITLLIASISLVPISALAETIPSWIRIISQDTYLYTNANTNKVTMMLQYSYYAKVLSEQGLFYQVELMSNTDTFPKIVGYVLISDVEVTHIDPITPYYPEESITVNSSNASIHLSPLSSAVVIITATNTQSMSYYGTINEDNNEWYYVFYSGVLGYVSSDTVTAPTVAPHPTPLITEPLPPTIGPTEDPVEPVSSTTEILLILFVCLLCVGLILALFLPNKSPSTNKTNSLWDRHI